MSFFNGGDDRYEAESGVYGDGDVCMDFSEFGDADSYNLGESEPCVFSPVVPSAGGFFGTFWYSSNFFSRLERHYF
jgi:hypothetical protein